MCAEKYKPENESTYSTAGALVRGMPVDFFFFSASKAAVELLETPLSDFFSLASATALEVELLRFHAARAG